MNFAFFLANSFRAQFTPGFRKPMAATDSSLISRVFCALQSLAYAPNSQIQKHEAPVHRMPTELVLLIFTFALPPSATSDGLSSIQEGPWVFSAVCSCWRTIALSQPCLWATISLDFMHEDWELPSFETIQPRLEAHLERSQQVPLHITFRACWHEAHCRELELPVMNILALHCNRWETASLTGSSMFYYHLSDSIRGNLSQLRAIDIRVRQEHPVPRGGPLTLFDSCPRLQEAFVNPGRYGGDCPLAIDLPFSQLRRYSGNNSWANHACVLRSTPSNLVDCVLHLIGSPAPSASRILLPYLRRLSVSSTDILALLDTPALQELYYHHSAHLPAFLARVPALRKLFVADIPSAEHLERILWAAPPTVAELCLYLPVQLASHLFAILGSRPGRDGVPAMALRALSLCFVPDSDRSSAPAPTPFDPGALLRCAEGLRSLKLYGGRGGVNLLPPLPSRLRVAPFPSSGALYADMVPEDFRLSNLDPDPDSSGTGRSVWLITTMDSDSEVHVHEGDYAQRENPKALELKPPG
ncbi:hypothetical protein DFH08DRAFT_1041503 [Mycena albidolilacea]|uniref:F-box domain-containing protein n=1 Tax=Mycena albidolilacea TaxID=1033008 RepID=A0AAD6ZAX1_9AGAR|nr:hypothetical protein DFH08DRAFT_1041503 [Mycena albidolilacea]